MMTDRRGYGCGGLFYLKAGEYFTPFTTDTANLKIKKGKWKR